MVIKLTRIAFKRRFSKKMPNDRNARAVNAMSKNVDDASDPHPRPSRTELSELLKHSKIISAYILFRRKSLNLSGASETY